MHRITVECYCSLLLFLRTRNGSSGGEFVNTLFPHFFDSICAYFIFIFSLIFLICAWITAERVRHFYQRNIICQFGLLNIIVSDNGTQFVSSSVVEFCRNLKLRDQFIYVKYPQANSQAEASNKIILSGMKRKSDDTKGLWSDYLHEILWSYHTTSYSTTKETLFYMVYRADAMIVLEVNSPTWPRTNFNNEVKQRGLENGATLGRNPCYGSDKRGSNEAEDGTKVQFESTSDKISSGRYYSKENN